MFESFNNILVAIDDFVWGVPLIVLILATGLYLTIRLRGLQFHKLILAFKYMFKNESEGNEGEVSSFAALCTSLSATIGTGNIVGVATAVVAGGAGALFWMWVAAIVGIATKYAECMLACKYREVAEDGHIVGGPFLYIEKGMGSKWKWLAKLFAIFGILAGRLGIGTFTQINGITSAVENFFDVNKAHTVSLLGMDYTWAVVISGLILTIFVALVIIGGIKRISKVAEVIVPFMAILYVVVALIIVTAFLISNTIKITIFSRKREIEIMRLVGSSNLNIKIPFIFEGLFLGILGSVIPIIITTYGYTILYKKFDGQLFSPFIQLIKPTPFIYQISLALLAIGILVGMYGSFKAVRKHLKI